MRYLYPHPMDPLVIRESTICLDDAIVLLRALADVYSATPDDVVELSLSSDWNVGVLVFPQASGSVKQLRRVLDLSGVAAESNTVLEMLWCGIPSRRCATRLLVGGGVSLFWPIDLDVTAVRSLAEGLGFGAAGDGCERFLLATGGQACGVAYERRPRRAPRCRFYLMAHHMAALEEALAAAVDRLGVGVDDARWLREWVAGPSGKRFETPIVINVAFDMEGSCSIKLELPGIPVATTSGASRLSAEEEQFWRAAARVAAGSGLDEFNYVGVRCDASGMRSLTAYVDGHAWITRPGRSVPHDLHQCGQAHSPLQSRLQVLLQR